MDKLYPEVSVTLDKVNYIDVKANSNIITPEFDVTLKNCVPRPMAGLFHRDTPKRLRKQWTFPISIFKDYVPDTEVLFCCANNRI